MVIERSCLIPEWAINKLFDLGVLGMTIPEQYGGAGVYDFRYEQEGQVIYESKQSAVWLQSPADA